MVAELRRIIDYLCCTLVNLYLLGFWIFYFCIYMSCKGNPLFVTMPSKVLMSNTLYKAPPYVFFLSMLHHRYFFALYLKKKFFGQSIEFLNDFLKATL